MFVINELSTQNPHPGQAFDPASFGCSDRGNTDSDNGGVGAITIGALAALRLAAYGLMFIVASCSNKDSVTAPSPEAPPAHIATDDAVQNPALAELTQKLLAQALEASLTLQQSITELLASHTLESLTKAQQAWYQAAERIEAFYVFSRLGAPSTSVYPLLLDYQYNLSAWPIEPGYLDAYGDHPYSGLVFDIGIPLTAELLRQQHGLTSEGDATLGIYALEFLIFGENNNRGPLLFQPITGLNKQHQAAGYEHVAELPRNRRRQLLQLQADLLVEDVKQLQSYWQTHAPRVSDDRFQRAALAMATEQIIEVAQQQKPRESEPLPQRLRRGQQLAVRLGAQLVGLQQALAVSQLPNHDTLLSNTQQAIERLQLIAQASTPEQPSPEYVKNRRNQWRSVYQDLRTLAAGLTSDAQQPNAKAADADIAETDVNGNSGAADATTDLPAVSSPSTTGVGSTKEQSVTR